MYAYAYSAPIKQTVGSKLTSLGLPLIAADMRKVHGIAANLQTMLPALKLAAVGRLLLQQHNIIPLVSKETDSKW
jgi:hypothetical protein